MPTRRSAAVALALVLVASACGGSSSRQARPTAKSSVGPAPASTAWGRLLARIAPDGTVDRYGHLVPGLQEDAAAAVGALLDP